MSKGFRPLLKVNLRNTQLFLIILIFVCCISGCDKARQYKRMEGMIWNTVYHITYKGPDHLKDSVIPVLEKVGKSLSVFDPKSLVSKLNSSDSVVADADLLIVYKKSKEINRLSKGLFDPTVSPLIDAWGFGIGHKATNDTTKIDSLLAFTGIAKTYLKDAVIVKQDHRTRFNFSAIAKGYGCDAVGEMFKRNGVTDYMIEIGGEIVLSGKSSAATDWHISIDSPGEDDNLQHESAMVISLTDVGIATSGNYRNYRDEGDKRLAHTISPLTGRPFFSEILSATVVAPTCMEADALATACMASPLDEAIKLLQSYKAEGVLICQDTLIITPGFRKFIISEVSEPGRKDRN